jgi:hypothetical protein
MKKLFFLFTVVSLFSFQSVRADECCEKTEATVQQRLRDIDLNIALKKYEQIQTEKAKAELQLVLIETETEASATDRPKAMKNLENRIQLLTAHADQVRARVVELSKALSVAAN